MARPAILSALAGAAAAISVEPMGVDVLTLQAAYVALMSGLGAAIGAFLDRL